MQVNADPAVQYYNERFGRNDISDIITSDHDLVRWETIRKIFLDNKSSEPITILDFGCGGGWVSHLMGEFGKVTGVDLADKAIEAANKKYPGTEFICLNAASISSSEFYQRTFDVVVSSEVIEHITDQTQYIQNLFSLLKPGGRLILTTPNGRWKDSWFTNERNSYRQPLENWVDKSRLTNLCESYLKEFLITTFYSQWLFYYPNTVSGSHLWSKLRSQFYRAIGKFDATINSMNKDDKGLYLILTGTKR